MSAVKLFTKRWNDPQGPDDGYRLLVCRYRPRGVRVEDETWDAWCAALAPSRELHAEAYGKAGPPLPFPEYARRYREEMSRQRYFITGFAERLARGETMTLLCSSACVDETRCHRTILAALLVEALVPPAPATSARVVRRGDPR